MKMISSLFVVVLLILTSCDKIAQKQLALQQQATKQDTVVDTNVVRVQKEYFSNGKIKTEVEAKGYKRHGLTKNYDREGHLLSQVNYVYNTREGMATNFYPLSGKVNSTLVYKNGIKEGDEIWYYESGKPYRVTPYVKGRSNGIQKLYYEDGKIKAEVPFKNGNPGMGLKEYKPDGSLITDYPKLIITQKDFMKQANKIILNIEMSDPKVAVKFYRGPLEGGKYISDKMLVLAIQNNIAQVDFNVAPGSEVMETVIISANVKTKFGNPLILSRTFTAKAMNNN